MDIEKIKEIMRQHPGYFQLCADNMNISIVDQKQPVEPQAKVTFGHYNSQREISYPFYKPISKVIDISKLK
ncbi:hypothetical protein [Taibaiella soli]|uniref:Uncharacterized protein n=1 Tax=Taibaiella soli TaxID=1649169 RepID=A0A2W2ANB8_9BACT|nr:hypothetical protein [Taibaiella soli]PZF73830.1 hypothetical protein DN068_05665 [Taibaiella soli]